MNIVLKSVKRCPHCGRLYSYGSPYCPYCQQEVEPVVPSVEPKQPLTPQQRIKRLTIALVVIGIFAVFAIISLANKSDNRTSKSNTANYYNEPPSQKTTENSVPYSSEQYSQQSNSTQQNHYSYDNDEEPDFRSYDSDEEPDFESYDSDEEPEFGDPDYGDSNNPGLYPFASERVLDYEELARYDLQQLKIMRNEIYARHGYIFRKGGEMEAYFKKQPWYQPLYTNVDQFLSSVETENIKKIRVLEGGN